jgi:hypothetical protein
MWEKRRRNAATGGEAVGMVCGLLARRAAWGYHRDMIRIRFSNLDSERKALGYLAGRFSFKSWASGQMIVPAAALSYLALEGISFSVEGPATYEQLVPPVRNPSAAAV